MPMNKEEVQTIAMTLISYAGDACSCFIKAVEEARKRNFEESDKLMAEGAKQLIKAHNSQTELLTQEASGEDMAYSIVMVHAQDHLMTTMMYERFAKEIIFLHRERD
jgi:cellobiose-specific phosphotransferase system component IIA